jgi:hypothetical protein
MLISKETKTLPYRLTPSCALTTASVKTKTKGPTGKRGLPNQYADVALAVLLVTLLTALLLATLARTLLLLLLLAGLLVRISALLLLTRLLVRVVLVLIVFGHLISFQGVFLECSLREARPKT